MFVTVKEVVIKCVFNRSSYIKIDWKLCLISLPISLSVPKFFHVRKNKVDYAVQGLVYSITNVSL